MDERHEQRAVPQPTNEPSTPRTPSDPLAEELLTDSASATAHRGRHDDHRHHAAERLRRLRDHARKAVQPSPEDTTGTALLSSAEIDLRHARGVLDLAARIASAALGAGATAADATAMVLRVTHSYGLSVHVDVTLTSVTISHFRSLENDPLTVLRTVRVQTVDHRKLELIEGLLDDLTTKDVALTQARHRIAEIIRTPKTYRRWVQTVAKGLLGLGVAALFGGNLADCLIAGLTTASVDLAVHGVDRIKAPAFFGQVAGAAVCGIVAILVMWGRAAPNITVTASPSLIVAAGMVSMLSGLSLTTAARDAIDGYVVTAAARLVEVVTLTGGIVLGLTMSLWVGLELGVPAYLSPSTGVSPVWWMQVLASGLIAVSFAVLNHLTPRSWALSAFFGLMTWMVATFVGEWVGSAPATAGAAAFVTGVVAQSLNRVVRVPTIALVTAGVVPLVPGMSVYRGLLAVVQSSQGLEANANAGMMLFQAVMVAVMLGAGVSLGIIAGRPLSMPSDWATRLALAKAWGRGRSGQSGGR